MNKMFLLLLALLATLPGWGQLVVNFQFPPAGFSYKPQLWNMVLINTTNSTMVIHAEVSLMDIGSGQQILNGTTRSISLFPGANQVHAGIFNPVQYNSPNNSFGVDNSPNGLLPLGYFEACYSFFRHVSDNVDLIGEQCTEISIQPLGPPQLVYPYDETAIQELNPILSWLPPVPVNLFFNLKYDLTVAEMGPLQTAADAIQQNLPLYTSFDVIGNSLLYPLNAPPLEFEKKYAWRVVAKSNNSVVGSSETWQFSPKQFLKEPPKNAEASFVKLRKAPETAYAVAVQKLKFEYFNETEDSVWNIKVIDLSNSNQNSKQILADSASLRRGQNLLVFTLENDAFFIDKHLYQVEIYNSRRETWRLRFQYRAQNNID